MDGLEKQVKLLIERLYCCIYEGDLTVEKGDDYYMLTLYFLNQPHCTGGTVYYKLCNTDEEFLDYLEKRLRHDRLDHFSYAQLKLLTE